MSTLLMRAGGLYTQVVPSPSLFFTSSAGKPMSRIRRDLQNQGMAFLQNTCFHGRALHSRACPLTCSNNQERHTEHTHRPGARDVDVAVTGQLQGLADLLLLWQLLPIQECNDHPGCRRGRHGTCS